MYRAWMRTVIGTLWGKVNYLSFIFSVSLIEIKISFAKETNYIRYFSHIKPLSHIYIQSEKIEHREMVHRITLYLDLLLAEILVLTVDLGSSTINILNFNCCLKKFQKTRSPEMNSWQSEAKTNKTGATSCRPVLLCHIAAWCRLTEETKFISDPTSSHWAPTKLKPLGLSCQIDLNQTVVQERREEERKGENCR